MATIIATSNSGIRADQINLSSGAWGSEQLIAGPQIGRDGEVEAVTAGTGGSAAIGIADGKQGLIIGRSRLAGDWALSASVNLGTDGAYLALNDVSARYALASWEQARSRTFRFIAERIRF